MSKIYIRRGFLIAAVLFFLQTLPAVANQPPTEKQPTDTTTTKEPPVPPDSAHEKTRREVSEVLEWLREAEADTADTTKPPRVQVVPPALTSFPGTDGERHSFPTAAANPHTAFADHLLWQSELEAISNTYFWTERLFSYHGLNPMPVRVLIDGVDIDLRRSTFPQTMSPDFMVVPPYMFSSFTRTPSRSGGLHGEIFSVQTFDSMVVQPYSDFFVRRGDYELSLTQGRLFRTLPGGRTVNAGFSFAQSEGRGRYDQADNRYLYTQMITPIRNEYNLAAGFYQYRTAADIQTADDFWAYNFRRDDLNWRFNALVFRGDTIHAPLVVRFVYDHNKQETKATSSAYSILAKKSRVKLAAAYTPPDADSSSGWRAGATIALQQLHMRSEHFRRPEYTLWSEGFRKLGEDHIFYLSASIDGNDDYLPAPQVTASWRFRPTPTSTFGIDLQRFRMMPSLTDREWLLHTAIFEDVAGRTIRYSEVGNEELSPWWSNSITARFGYTPARWLTFEFSGWGSYEQDYYRWQDQAEDDTTMAYQPSGIDARTVGASIGTRLSDLGPFAGRIMYVYKLAEEVNGKRLADCIDHRITSSMDADVKIRKFNLDLHAAVEFMYWRAPSAEYTSYDSPDIFRTDVLGSATIKNFTIYWLAQNVFNYGYRKAPGYNYLGQTIMWGLHLRFFN